MHPVPGIGCGGLCSVGVVAATSMAAHFPIGILGVFGWHGGARPGRAHNVARDAHEYAYASRTPEATLRGSSGGCTTTRTPCAPCDAADSHVLSAQLKLSCACTRVQETFSHLRRSPRASRRSSSTASCGTTWPCPSISARSSVGASRLSGCSALRPSGGVAHATRGAAAATQRRCGSEARQRPRGARHLHVLGGIEPR